MYLQAEGGEGELQINGIKFHSQKGGPSGVREGGG